MVFWDRISVFQKYEQFYDIKLNFKTEQKLDLKKSNKIYLKCIIVEKQHLFLFN